jgi:flagellin
MAAILSTNMASLYAQKNLSTAQASLSDSVQRLSSGTRINSAKDDAAGYGIAESIKGTKAITDQSILNTKNAISQVQTAEGALDVVGKILQRVLTLTTQRQDGTLNTDQTNSINNEIASLLNEVQNVKERTMFQGGSGATSVFGATNAVTTGAGVTSTIEIADLSLGGVGTTGNAAPYWTGTLGDIYNASPEEYVGPSTTILSFPSGTFSSGLPLGTSLYMGDGTIKIDSGASVTGFTTNPDGTQSVTLSGIAYSSSALFWAEANNLLNSPEDIVASFDAPGRSTPATMDLSALGPVWVDNNTDPGFQADLGSNGPVFYMAASGTANASEVRAGMQVFKNGEDTGLVVSSVQYSQQGFSDFVYEIKTTGTDDDLTQTFDYDDDVITFTNGAASQTNYLRGWSPDLQSVSSFGPIPGLVIGSHLADNEGRYIGTVSEIRENNQIILSDFQAPNSPAVQLITSIASLSAQPSNGDQTLSINAANPNIVSGSVLTDEFGTYLGTVGSVSGDGRTINLTAPMNFEYIEAEISPGAIIQIASPSDDAPVITENDPNSLNLVDASDNAAANGKIASSAYFDASGNVQSLEADDVADLSAEAVQGAIQINSTNRADLGAWLNRLDYAVDNMQTLSTNLADGISRIVDTDYAAETSNLTRTQIMQQAATSMLAQANQMPNVILTLLK